MFRRKRLRIAPEVDFYVRRRYEDLADCIHKDISCDRGLLCHYSKWLDFMMEKFNLPEDYKSRHSLVLKDPEGRHIGCSGAVKNTLNYFNPISPTQRKNQWKQSEEALQKKRLSAELSKRTSQITVISGGAKLSKEEIACKGKALLDSESSSSSHGGQKTGASKTGNIITVLSPRSFVEKESDYSGGTTNGQPQQSETFAAKMMEAVVRPDSSNSYYARVDEAFRKHREKSSIMAWERSEERNAPFLEQSPEANNESNQAVEEDRIVEEKNQSSKGDAAKEKEDHVVGESNGSGNTGTAANEETENHVEEENNEFDNREQRFEENKSSDKGLSSHPINVSPYLSLDKPSTSRRSRFCTIL